MPKDPPSDSSDLSTRHPPGQEPFRNSQAILPPSSCAIINDDTTYIFTQDTEGNLVVHYGEGYAFDDYVSTTVVSANSVAKGNPIACVLVDYTPPVRPSRRAPLAIDFPSNDCW